MASYQPGYWTCDWCPHGRFDSEEEAERHEIDCSCAPPEVFEAKDRFKSFWGDHMGPCTATIRRELLKAQKRGNEATSIREAVMWQMYGRMIRLKSGITQTTTKGD